MRKKFIPFYVSMLLFISVLFSYGCKKDETLEDGLIRAIPETAKILFLSNMDVDIDKREIYSMDAEGGNITRITYLNEHLGIFGIDKAKNYIVATKTDPATGNKSLILINLNTGEIKELTDSENNAEGDSFSPDGQWIVFFMTLKGESQSDIYKIKTDGTELTRLTNTEDATECDPAWSSEGTKIAFVSYSAQVQRFVLKTMDTNGNNIQTVYDCQDTISTPYFKPGVYDPSWSHDDEWIVFEKPVSYNGENGGAGIWHIFKIHPDGSSLLDLSENGNHTDMAEYLPSFSPDGSKIIYSARYKDGSSVNIDIFLMDSSGIFLKRNTNTQDYNEFGIWLPE